MNAQSPFTVKDATVYRSLEAAPRAFAEWPEAIRAKLLSGDLYVMSAEDCEDRTHGGVYLRTDALTGITWASWRHLLGDIRWQEVAIDTPLCSSCDLPVLAGPCDCEVG